MMSRHSSPVAGNSQAPRRSTPTASVQRAASSRVLRLGSLRRFEYGLLALTAVFFAVLGVVFFLVDIDLARLNSYGYGGLFVVSLVSAASIVLPMPGVAAVTGAGALLDPVFGIPAPILVGLVAGPAEALGECTGYAAGYGGSRLFRDRSFYPRVQRWMTRRGAVTMFLLSSFPNPLLDVAGVAAGAVKLEFWRFFTGVLAGKVLKNVYLASGGLAAAELARRLLG